jgi:hypothetical protein
MVVTVTIAIALWLVVVLVSSIVLLTSQAQWPKYLLLSVASTQLLLLGALLHRGSFQASYQEHDLQVQKTMYDELLNRVELDLKDGHYEQAKNLLGAYRNSMQGNANLNDLARFLQANR